MQSKNRTKPNLIEKAIRLVVTRGTRWGLRELDKGGQKVQTSSYKINKS